MEVSTVFVLATFNRLHKKMNVLYHDYAKSVGLSDAAFWLLYSLYEHGQSCTQKDLCSAWFYAPQTINTALKNLEEQGFIKLELAPKSRKNKQIFFTDKGKTLIDEKIVPLVHAEERSFDRLEEQERSQLLALTQKHIGIVEEEIRKINSTSSEDGSSQ
ncbi:MAG: MarR family transcriptional regulator [bacterium]|nr:MarR family transcriptional regulator [bacterium]